jgi:hypothetical protein
MKTEGGFPGRWWLSAVVMGLAFMVVFWLSGRESREHDQARALRSSASEAATSSGVKSFSNLQHAVAMAGGALAQARMTSPAPSIDRVPSTLTPYQKLRLNYRSVDWFHQSLLKGTVQKLTACRGLNDSMLSLKITFRSNMNASRAILTDPAFSLNDGGGIPLKMQECLRNTYDGEQSLAAEPGYKLPDYDGPIEIDVNVGVAPAPERERLAQ